MRKTAAPQLLANDAAARWAAAGAAASRLLIAAAALAAASWLPTVPVGASKLYPAKAGVFHGLLAHLLVPWTHWDGAWFLRIASDGYTRPASPAFFPLYPLLVRGLGLVFGGNLVIAAVVISLAAYALAMVALYRLAAAEIDRRTALWTVVFISVFPAALFFQAAYSESLFLLFTSVALLAARRGRWLWAGLAGLLATLTRNAGIVLLVPLGWLWWDQRRGGGGHLPGGPPPHGGGPATQPATRSLLWLLLVPAGLGLYMVYLWQRFGDALLFSSAQSRWGRSLASPISTVVSGIGSAIRSAGQIAAGTVPQSDGALSWSLALGNITALIALVLAVLLVIVCWRRLPAAYTLYGLAALAVPLCFPTASKPLLSLPRFILVDFPLFIALAAGLLRHPAWRWAVLAIMTAGVLVATILFATWNWVA
ncbi:MAG: mannosyltransferase family protein [Thermoleophilia bacterium]